MCVGTAAVLPQGFWQLHANKATVLCMSHALAEWNEHLNHAAQECVMLASQVLISMQVVIEQRLSDLLQVLDSVALLDMLSGFVAYMQSRKAMCSFCRPTLCQESGSMLLNSRYPWIHSLEAVQMILLTACCAWIVPPSAGISPRAQCRSQ
jgi:DNA mismatch repair ATPase MutS